MQRISSALASAAVVLGMLATAQVASAQFANLVNRVPDDANAILVIDVDKLLASPMAQDEGGRTKAGGRSWIRRFPPAW